MLPPSDVELEFEVVVAMAFNQAVFQHQRPRSAPTGSQTRSAELPDTVVFVSAASPLLKMPPPHSRALFPEMVLFVSMFVP